jgi:hypothetical protein
MGVLLMNNKENLLNQRKILTGLWSKASEDSKQPFIKLFNDEHRAGEFHKIYFQWYNIIHEFGHLLRDYHGIQVDWLKEGATEEQAVNDFAMAYWKMFGEKSKLEFIMDEIEYMLNKIPSPVPKDEDLLNYYNKHFQELQSVELYAFLQCTCVKRAFDSSETLNEVLDRFGIINRNILGRELVYSSQYEPECIADDCSKILNEMGVMTPNVEVVLLDNPQIHCAK